MEALQNQDPQEANQIQEAIVGFEVNQVQEGVDGAANPDQANPDLVGDLDPESGRRRTMKWKDESTSLRQLVAEYKVQHPGENISWTTILRENPGVFHQKTPTKKTW